IEQSLEAKIDPMFVFSFIKNSSNFNASQKLNNKFGLMQIGEDEAKLAAKFITYDLAGKSALLNPEINLKLGLAYLKICHNIFDNNSFHSIAGYRWGVKNLIFALKNKSDIPPLVTRYPQKILDDYKNFRATSSPAGASSGNAQNANLNIDPLQALICQSSQDLSSCKELASKFKKEADSYQVNSLIIARYAKIQSNFQASLEKNNKFGLFQWSSPEAEKIASYAKVAWAGPKELLKAEYAIRIACKYYQYLEQRFKGNEKYIAIALFWDVEELTTVINKKGVLPNEINSLASQLLQK
ncbi:MAG: transglycosylase SLT domain-containing protein, partial [Candidatus Paceibacterota bacterium]